MKTYQKVIIALLVCSFGLGAVLWLKREKKVDLPMGKEPVPVEVVKARSGSILRRIRVVGSLTAVQSVVLRPEVSGKVAKIYFTEGATVNAGDPIFKIDDAMYKAKVKEAEAQLAQTRAEYGRATKLLEKKFGTLQQRDKTLADMQVAEAHLDEAKVSLDHTLIKAPFEGVLGLTETSLGALVSGETELVTIVDLDPINVDFHLPESYLPFVHTGDEVDVTIEDFDILPVEAKIIAISPEIDKTTRTVTLRAQMSNKEHAYRPGEFAHVLVTAGKVEDAVLIPQTAIEREGEEEHVWVVADNIAIKTTVSIGMRDGNDVEITHGLKADDVVISAGQFKVHDGDEVTIVDHPQGDQPKNAQPQGAK